MPPAWPYWVGQTYTAASTNAWNIWIDSTYQVAPVQTVGTQVNPLQATVWIQWQNQQITPMFPPPPVLTAEQEAQQQREAARRNMICRNRERAKWLRRRHAERRAEALLLEHLSAAQREEWEAERAFTVHTADGKRAYKIAYGLAGNVRLIKADEPLTSKRGLPIRPGAKFCMHVYHPDGWVPYEDNVLAQKLLIESNEPHFLELANVS